MVDPGPDENSELWRKLDAYHEAVANDQDTSDICTLETVLESKDVLSFLQHNHQPLITFLTTKEHLSKILKYISSCPDSQTILSQRSCKILCHNSAAVREALFADASENLDILFGFEDEDQLESSALAGLDPMHSGLLTQVVQKFLNTHNWYMVDYLSNKDALKEKPQQLLSSPGLLQTLVDANYCYSGSALGQWMESINMVDILVSAFKGDKGDAAVTCAAEVLRIIIQSASPLLQQLESKEVISKLLEYAFNSENPSAVETKTEVTTVCKVLCEKYNNEGCENIPEPLIPIVGHLEDFNAILAPTEGAEGIVNTSGTIIPFGMRRMKVVELYAALLCVGSDEINQAMLDKGVFQYLLNAFFLYKWNNILQTSVMAMFHLVFHAERHEFCKRVLEKTDLIPKVSVLLMEDLEREKAGEPVSAYRGFFRTFSSTFLNLRVIPELTPVFESYEEWQKLLTLLQPPTAPESTSEPTIKQENMEIEQPETESVSSDSVIVEAADMDVDAENKTSEESPVEPESEPEPQKEDVEPTNEGEAETQENDSTTATEEAVEDAPKSTESETQPEDTKEEGTNNTEVIESKPEEKEPEST